MRASIYLNTNLEVSNIFKFSFLFIAVVLAVSLVQAQCLEVATYQKISDTRGYFTGILDNVDRFGIPAYIGDINGDGIGDIVVGAPGDDDGGTDRGAVYVIFLDKYGRSISFQKISDTQGNFSGVLDNGDNFGGAVANAGDLNGDGVNELLVGSQYDDDGGVDRGALWVVYLNVNGTVKKHQKVSDTQGNFVGSLSNNDHLGGYLGPAGDLNRDGIPDIVVGAYNDDDGGVDRGAVWVMFMDSSGSVVTEQKISDTQGNFMGTLNNSDKFGRPHGIGDINGDNIPDLAVGATLDDDGGTNRGAVWILFMDTTGMVKSHQKISDTAGNFTGILDNTDQMGNSVRPIGDIDGNGVNDIIVCGADDDDGGTNRGAVWIMYLSSTGKVNAYIKISDLEGNFIGNLSDNDFFGARLASLGDFNNDGLFDIAVSATKDDDGGSDRGAVWILSLQNCIGPCGGGIQNTFSKSYGGSGHDRGHCLIETTDGKFVFTGTTTSFGAGSTDFFVIKTTIDGDTLWAKTFGGTGLEIAHSITIVETPNGGFILAGRTYSFSVTNGAIYVLKLNINGDIEWQKVVYGIGNDHASDVKCTSDTGYIVVGTNGHVIKLDSLGNLEWNNWYWNNSNIHFGAVKEVFDKGYLVAGNTTGYGQGGRSGIVIMVDLNGMKLWEKVYDTPFQENMADLEIINNTEFVFFGLVRKSISTSSMQFMMLKTDSVGKPIWAKSYSSGSSMDRGLGFIQTQDGGFVLSGYSENSTNPNVLIKTDQFGNIIWSRGYKGHLSMSSSNETIGSDNVVELSSGGFAMVNYIRKASSMIDDVFLFTTTSCGESACDDISYTYLIDEVVYNIINTNTIDSAYGTIATPNTIVHVFNADDSLICEFDYECQLKADFSFDSVCVGDTVHFADSSYDNLANVVGWQWYFGDGDSLFNVQNPNHLYASSGIYNAQLIVFNDDTSNCSDTITKSIVISPTPTLFFGPDSVFCFGDTIQLNAPLGTYDYLWSDSSTNSFLDIDTTGTYWGTIQFTNGSCYASDTIGFIFDIPPIIDLGLDSILCQGDSVGLSVFVPLATYLWSDTSTGNSIVVDSSGNYWVQVTKGSCEVSDTINFQFNQYPVVDLGSDSVLCYRDTLKLYGSSSNYIHLWSNASIDTMLLADTTSTYWVEVTNGPCSASDTINLVFDIPPLFTLGNDTILCQGDSLSLSTGLTSSTYLWSDNSTGNTIDVGSSGLFWVEVTTGACIDDDSIQVIVEDSILLDLGNDTVLCEGSILTLNAANNNSSYLWSDNSSGPFNFVANTGFYWVRVQSALGACQKSDSIDVVFDPLPNTDIGSNKMQCEGDTVILNASWPGATYLWSTSSVDSSIEVVSSGSFWVMILSGACTVRDSVDIQFNNYPVIDVLNKYGFCPDKSVMITIDSTFDMIQWSNGDTTYTPQYYKSGKHWVMASNGPCISSDTFLITEYIRPDPLLKHNYQICEQKFVLVDGGNPGATFDWSNGETKQIAMYNIPGSHSVEIVSSDGCRLEDYFTIEICETPLIIPNTITPNGDGKNDTWIIGNIDLFPGNSVKIFNRNGNLLFSTTNYQSDWDGTWNGKELPATVYYFILDLNDGSEVINGTITVIRQQ